MAFGVDDAALATILGGVISTAGALYTNKKNLDANDKANLMNWQIARENNATQIAMANSAHQREVADLRMAGLNPILSAGGNGSSTPTLSGATMNPIQQSNAFEGLANSAKGLARYFSQEYKNKLASQLLSNELTSGQAAGVKIANEQSNLDFERSVNEYNATQPDLHADEIQGQVRKVATMLESGLQLEKNSDGTYRPTISDEAQFRRAVELEREGIRADMKSRGNANWRANLSSFVPFVSPAAINSARNATRATVPAYRRGTP